MTIKKINGLETNKNWGAYMKNIKCTNAINQKWHLYSRTIASLQLDAFGIIFLDESNKPIADSQKLKVLYGQYKADCLSGEHHHLAICF